METPKLKKFAQYARRSLIEQVGSQLEQVVKVESAARRELPQVVDKLEEELTKKGKEQLVEQVAYIWFNRFCALRFMDVNGYNRIGVLSPAEGQFQPEILAEAKAGHIDEVIVKENTRNNIFGLLNGSIKSRDGQAEAYRLLIAAVCNDYYRLMPYLFERIEDYTELLMPDDLLSGNSILAYTREAMTPEACESVESIGWLYQYYISEKKDQVFGDLKKNKKITPENIPAATQLFTPHWIVRYLVENSLGRLWMLNNPNSKVIEQMDYYIKPVHVDADYLKISSPEEIKICDPACGSGHMLTYAYDLLYAIYLDAGYDPTDIPELILIKNLYGIEIDERAAELAAFALSMKAVKGNPQDESNNRRHFFRNPIKPNICRLEKTTFTEEEMDNYIDFIGKDLFTQALQATLKDFEEADNFGSLIQPTIKNVEDVISVLEAKDVSGQLFLKLTHESVLKVLKQADYLSQKYHVVIANPPYMGGKGMNPRLSKWAKDTYPDSKSDLFAMFIERGFELIPKFGYNAMVTMQSWMFLSSFEKLRSKILRLSSIESMSHMANMVMGIAFGTSATVWKKAGNTDTKGSYCWVEYEDIGDDNSPIEFPPKNERNKTAKLESNSGLVHLASAEDFNKIPGSPIAYWAPKSVIESFVKFPSLKKFAIPSQGMATTNNDLFLRQWYEVASSNFIHPSDVNKETRLTGKWFACNKGGPFKKWYGNNSFIVNYENDGQTICDYIDNTPNVRVKSNGRVINRNKYFKVGATWSTISSSSFSMRYSHEGFIFETKGAMCFPGDRKSSRFLTALGCSKVVNYLLEFISPTVDYHEGPLGRLPIAEVDKQAVDVLARQLIDFAIMDWDSYEVSWDFKCLKLIPPKRKDITIDEAYYTIRQEWRQLLLEMRRLEEENNRIFINAYGFQEQLTTEVPLNEITLMSNPYYRYGSKKTDDELEALLLVDTIYDFISYSVGCMFGRYSVDKEGLLLVNQGENLEYYLKQIPNPSFMPDDDNVIPLIDFEGDWFEDDISERFKQFLKITFGKKNLAENLTFIEGAIGKSIKKYFVKDFYVDHVKRYKKRPIYWMFSSPKGGFNALIYIHRYRPDTVSVVLNDYLREFRTKLLARKESYKQVEVSASASQKEKTQAIKAITKINKVIDEVNEYERDILYPLAGQNIEIDLDDGVKHNYPLFGDALKKITGLS